MRIARRRDFLKSAALTAGALALPSLAASAQASAGAIHLGAQTNCYPIDPKDFSTFLAAVNKLHAIGFTGFETGFRNVMSQFESPEGRARIDATGMIFFGIHIFLQASMYDPASLIAPAELYRKVALGGKALGAHNLICSGAAAADSAQLKSKVLGLNAAAAFCRGIGIGFAYHNEEPESASRLDELDILCSETDPSVKFLLDVGHLYNVGGDVVAFIRRNHDRLVGLHIRDYRDHQQVVLGAGTLPIAQIAQALDQLHWSGWVECEEERLDGVKHGDEFMRPAFTALHAAFEKPGAFSK